MPIAFFATQSRALNIYFKSKARAKKASRSSKLRLNFSKKFLS